ncbi:MAG: phosphotransferase [Pseudomonadota bacterium]|nr:phosphotransferase [Pseudomonadota bacterium]
MDAKSAKPFEDAGAIEAWCARRDLPVRVVGPLGDGALNLHWAMEHLESGAALVFRCRAEGHWITGGFEAEARAMTLARQAGLLAPEVVLSGAQALVMTRLEGSADRAAALSTAADNPAFEQDVTGQLLRLRSATAVDAADTPGEPWLARVIDAYIAAPQGGLELLDQPAQARARAIAAAALETGVGRVCLNHGDFRTGNLLVQAGRLSGVLDWEFAGYRPEEADVGWMLSSPWRYGRPDLDASGLMARETLLDALGQGPTPRLAAWEALALVRWAVIARRQDQRQQVPAGTNADEGALLDEAEALVAAL